MARIESTGGVCTFTGNDCWEPKGPVYQGGTASSRSAEKSSQTEPATSSEASSLGYATMLMAVEPQTGEDTTNTKM
jgi:hypothetical protein